MRETAVFEIREVPPDVLTRVAARVRDARFIAAPRTCVYQLASGGDPYREGPHLRQISIELCTAAGTKRGAIDFELVDETHIRCSIDVPQPFSVLAIFGGTLMIVSLYVGLRTGITVLIGGLLIGLALLVVGLVQLMVHWAQIGGPLRVMPEIEALVREECEAVHEAERAKIAASNRESSELD